MIQQRDSEADSPRLHVSFLGREYYGNNGAQSFTVTSTLTNIFDGWTLDLPVSPGFNDDIPDLEPNRWLPIVFKHADPRVDNGKPIPLVMGVCTHCELITGDGPSVLRLTGYDLGKLLDSCVRPWVRFRGLSLEGMINKLIDPTWLAPQSGNSGSLVWGIQGVRGLNGNRTSKLGQRISTGSAVLRREYNSPLLAVLPPVQTEVGETFYDLISRYSRLTGINNSTGAFVNVSSDGWIQIFNPDESKNESPLYVFEDHDDTRNFKVKRSSLVLDGEDLYSEYRCYGSVIYPPQTLKNDQFVDYNAGRFFGQTAGENIGPPDRRLNRLLTFADAEQYKRGFAAARAIWRHKQSLYREVGIRLTVQGHSMPGPDGKWRPIVEGNICELNSTRLKRQGRFLIEQVVKRQADAPQGTECDVLLRMPGLLGA